MICDCKYCPVGLLIKLLKKCFNLLKTYAIWVWVKLKEKLFSWW